jgi:hypothetical protein
MHAVTRLAQVRDVTRPIDENDSRDAAAGGREHRRGDGGSQHEHRGHAHQ